jgi:uncharacterized protein
VGPALPGGGWAGRTRVWAKDLPFGTELAHVRMEQDVLSARGVAIGTTPVPYRLDYQLTTAHQYVTARLVVLSEGQGWRRTLDLMREPSGRWSCRTEVDGDPDLPAPGGDLSLVDGALDCDLGLSPLTNSMPVLRHRLHQAGGPVDFLMAWVSVPDLAVHASRQRYTFVRHETGAHIVRFESLDDPFAAEICFDDVGVVLDYPGIARCVA